MGLIGHYIDMLPARARDRLIQAQDWGIAQVRGPDGTRCLIGHAEDWIPLPLDRDWWRGWMDEEIQGDAAAAPAPFGSVLELACQRELFAFRRTRPADLSLYRERIRRWGWSSERKIGSRFDRLCARRGLAEAVRLVKARAARRHAPDEVAERGATAPCPRRRGVLEGVG